ncbi:MAG: DUF2934 domain-containing protein [Geminicoccaceae bacterium]
MNEAWEQRVRERAYAIWQREGNVDGSAEQFWLMAEEELLAEDRSAASSSSGEPLAPPVKTEAAVAKKARTRKRP